MRIETRARTILACIGLIALAVLVTFGPLVRASFTDWDDPSTIWANPNLRPATLAGIGHYWTHSAGELYIPLTYSVWGGLAHLGHGVEPNGAIGPEAMWFHGANVIVHLLAAIVAFLILLRIIPNLWAACAGALIFALHPLQTEPIAWASGMKDLLGAMLALIALWQYLIWAQSRAQDDPNSAKCASSIHYWLALFAMALAMLAKPTAVVTPLLAMTLDLFIVRRSFRDSVRALWPMFLLAIPCVIWTHIAQPPALGAHVALWARPIVALDAMAFYLWKIIWPTSLAIDYGRSPQVALAGQWIRILCCIPIALAAWIGWKRNRTVMASGLIAFIGLLPVLGFVPFEFQTRSTVSDHYMYLPMLGVAMFAAWGITRVPPKAALYVAAIVIGLLALRSLDQTRYWKDSPALFARALEVNPNSYSANENIGVLFAHDAEMNRAKAMLCQRNNDLAGEKKAEAAIHRDAVDADASLSRVLELKPGYASALHNRAILRARFGRHEDAIQDLKTLTAEYDTLAAPEKMDYMSDFTLLGQEQLRMNRPAEAIKSFNRMLALHPGDVGAARGRQRAIELAAKAATQPVAQLPLSR